MTSSASTDRGPLLAAVRSFAQGVPVEEQSRLLFDSYYPRLLRFFTCKSFCSAADAEDLTQETWGRVSRWRGRLAAISEIEQFQALLFEVATNVLRNWWRNRQAEKRRGIETPLDVLEERAQAFAALGAAVDAANPLDLALERERTVHILRALRALPVKMQRCAWLFYAHGESVNDIAVITGIKVNTVKAHLHQARKKLKELLGPLFDAAGEDDEA